MAKIAQGSKARKFKLRYYGFHVVSTSLRGRMRLFPISAPGASGGNKFKYDTVSDLACAVRGSCWRRAWAAAAPRIRAGRHHRRRLAARATDAMNAAFGARVEEEASSAGRKQQQSAGAALGAR